MGGLEDAATTRMTVRDATARPAFSLILLDDATPVAELVDSLRGQQISDWQLVIVTSRAEGPLQGSASADDRVRLVEASGSASSAQMWNLGLEGAGGEFVVRVDSGDRLPADSLGTVAEHLRRNPETDVLYGDEKILDSDGRVDGVHARPAWSPERLRWQDYCGHFVFFRSSLLRDLDGAREDFADALDLDLLLRSTEHARRVVHVAHGLSARRRRTVVEALPEKAAELEARAVREHLSRIAVDAEVELDPGGGRRLHRRLATDRSVSIVIPTAGTTGEVWGVERTLVVDAVRSILERTHHDRFDIVVVADDHIPPEVLDELRKLGRERLTIAHFREPFNFSRKVNLGALVARGERIVLLNDDVEVIEGHWLDELVAPLDEPGVGVTGARLLYPDGTLQHAGLAEAKGAGFLHPYRAAPADAPGYGGVLKVSREVSAVTGACLAVRRDVFDEAGGFTERLPASYNDVDFCLKIRLLGYRILLMRGSELYHFETMTRTPRVERWELDFVIERWGPSTRDDYTPVYPEIDDAVGVWGDSEPE